MNRYSLRVPAADAEVALARMLDLFPEGVEEQRDGADVVLAGYAEEAPASDLEPQAVEPGWEDAWRAFHRPVRVGPVWIGPPWFEPDPDALAVVIDPGRAFGTGAHGSTRAALDLLARLEPSPALDLGCGSGVLSVAAVRLGFGPIQAFDVDPLAVGATADNASRNGVEVAVASADVLADPLPSAPLWLANLELGILERLLRRADLPPRILASGLTAGQTLGGGLRAEVDGWAAELLEP
ncbi:MAG TPA: 50S ribosomal protein L11 methyltransferase [Gaiellales bacterium]|nr:50S ribosomal protein L11 methyltransferase [Gaiellales bacterium]